MAINILKRGPFSIGCASSFDYAAEINLRQASLKITIPTVPESRVIPWKVCHKVSFGTL
jgi:hypothetical protein